MEKFNNFVDKLCRLLDYILVYIVFANLVLMFAASQVSTVPFDLESIGFWVRFVALVAGLDTIFALILLWKLAQQKKKSLSAFLSIFAYLFLSLVWFGFLLNWILMLE